MSDPLPLKVAVVGVTGYAGYELARLLLRHPHVEKTTFYLRGAHSDVRCLTELFPQLRGWGDAPCRPLSVDAIAQSGADVAFLSTPHEASLELIPQLLAANPALRIIDLSGAYRFHDAGTFSRWYKLPAPDAKTLAESVYGLPELYADALPKARIVGNPGCYPTSVILGLRPLVEAGWINMARGIVCDCKSGVTGAGKEPKRDTHFVEVNENFRAYGLFTHRHTPEVSEHLGLKAEDFVFTTHLLPVDRGILSTLYVWLNGSRKADEVEALYRKFYTGRPMVRVMPAGTLPELQFVTHTNFCDIGFALDPSGERLVVVSCLDNLGKGAAGQAVQNLNGMHGVSRNGGFAMRLVIKIAGALLEHEEDVQTLARQITELARAGHELLVIHGGGRIFTATLARMGITSRFISGLRVTDRETRDAAVMVFAGLLNKKLAGAISLAGYPAVGISATDAACFLAEPMQIEDREGSLGFVGYLTEVNVDFLRSLWREGLIPVASCLGLGADGELYNINADHMAAAAAEFIRADRLIFLTDVAGVLDGEKVLSTLRGTDIEDLIRHNKVSGGMILKLEAAKRALAGGVGEVRIVGGSKPRALLTAANGSRGPGTRVLPVLRASARAAHGTAH